MNLGIFRLSTTTPLLFLTSVRILSAHPHKGDINVLSTFGVHMDRSIQKSLCVRIVVIVQVKKFFKVKKQLRKRRIIDDIRRVDEVTCVCCG